MPSVAVDKAWVRLPAAEGQPAAAYFTLEARGGDAALTAIDSPAAQRIELHESVTEGGVVRMLPLDRVAVPAGETVAFEPGGKHAMLFGLGPEVTPGGTVVLNFSFEGAPAVSAQAEVRSVAGGGHSGH
ncbi:MAG: copper chaperone PCu(A)C [Allosphingosinicella sp.]